MKTTLIPPTPQSDATVIVGSEPMLDALIERELQQQQELQRHIRLLAQREALMRRRRQTTIVAALINITSVAALIAIALVWQFYFPMAQAVAAMLP